jgi:hypothetical protein
MDPGAGCVFRTPARMMAMQVGTLQRRQLTSPASPLPEHRVIRGNGPSQRSRARPGLRRAVAGTSPERCLHLWTGSVENAGKRAVETTA